MIMNTDNINKYVEILNKSHNIVLTGAPGTGKTYLAKQIAVKFIFGDDVDFEKLSDTQKEVFNHRTAFVQFHPSYDYTDFVEGLRPVQHNNMYQDDNESNGKGNSDEIKFERCDGVFKKFCKLSIFEETASIHETQSEHIKYLTLTEKDIENAFNSLWRLISNNAITRLPNQSGKTTQRMYVKNKKTTIYFEKQNPTSKEGDRVTLDKIIKEFKSGKNCVSKLKEIKANRENFSGGFVSNQWAVLNYLLQQIEMEKEANKVAGIKNNAFVFIIDEINRGEISKIFGELFFSIDPGYRGEDGRVMTQYQNLVTPKDRDGSDDPFYKGFYVPKNVYIIGTMNDIDRSIESMDFAIRRRFAWVEIKAKDNLDMLKKLNGLHKKAEDVLTALNEKIDTIDGLGSSYHIGASYFLKLSNFEDNPFENLWEYHLQGLLKEYLRGMDNSKEIRDELKECYDNAYKTEG